MQVEEARLAAQPGRGFELPRALEQSACPWDKVWLRGLYFPACPGSCRGQRAESRGQELLLLGSGSGLVRHESLSSANHQPTYSP